MVHPARSSTRDRPQARCLRDRRDCEVPDCFLATALSCPLCGVVDPSAPSWTARHPRSPDFSDLSPSPPTVLNHSPGFTAVLSVQTPAPVSSRLQDTPGLRRWRREVSGACGRSSGFLLCTSRHQCTEGSVWESSASSRCRISEQFCSLESPLRHLVCGEPVPAGSSCCAPVESRRLSSEAAPRAPVPGRGRDWWRLSPGSGCEPMRAREDRAAPAPGPASHHSRKEGHTEREGGRKNTGSRKDRWTRSRLQTYEQRHAKRTQYGQQTDSETSLSHAWTPAFVLLIHGHSPSRHSPVGSQPQD